jgi:hypothetical protein
MVQKIFQKDDKGLKRIFCCSHLLPSFTQKSLQNCFAVSIQLQLASDPFEHGFGYFGWVVLGVAGLGIRFEAM